jgi:hypothetical protein
MKWVQNVVLEVKQGYIIAGGGMNTPRKSNAITDKEI